MLKHILFKIGKDIAYHAGSIIVSKLLTKLDSESYEERSVRRTFERINRRKR